MNTPVDAKCSIGRDKNVSELTEERLQRLVETASLLADKVGEKLYGVMTSDCPRPCGIGGSEIQEYPPLFDRMRSCMNGLESSLDAIDYAIQRTEL